MRQEELFNKWSLHEYFETQLNTMQGEVNEYDPDELLQVSEMDLQRYLVDRYLIAPLQLLIEDRYQDEPRDTNDFSGTIITVRIPFVGDHLLFYYRPISNYSANLPVGKVSEQEVKLSYKVRVPDAGQLSPRVQRDIQSLQEHVESVNNDLSEFNRSLIQKIETAIANRKQKILADRKLSAALQIPLKRRDNAPRTYTVPDIRKRPRIQRPTVATEAPYAPEPALADTEYSDILRIIQNMVTVMELSPQAFVGMGEEDLRWQFLVQLNGQYEGRATGETFNFAGDTDIRINFDGKNIFIAECKIWDGPKSLTDALDQLLGYTSWRDTKTAILLFNRDRNFSATVLPKVPSVVESHPCYKRYLGVEDETIFRYVFHQPEDPNRELLLTVMAFDIPR